MVRSLFHILGVKSSILAMAVNCVTAGYATAAEEDVLNRRIQDYSVKQDTFIGGLMELAGRYRLALAIEWTQDPHLKDLTRNWRDQKIVTIIDDLVKSEPQYSWRQTGNVVHVYHDRLLQDQRNFLNLVLERFESHQTAERINAELFEAVRKRVRPRDPALGGRAGSGGAYIGQPTLRFSTERLTVREVLNKLILENSVYKIRIVTYPPSRTLTSTAFLEVANTLRILPLDQRCLYANIKYFDNACSNRPIVANSVYPARPRCACYPPGRFRLRYCPRDVR